MIFKVSLFLATISAASAKMRGQVHLEQKGHAERHLMSDMSSNSNSNGNMGMGMGGGTGAAVTAGGNAPITSVRSIDGSENELAAPDAELQRFSGPAHYPDGQGLGVSMFDEPNARDVSNAVATMPEGVEKAPVSDIFWQWGQFMDHDYTLAEGIAEVADIVVSGDPDGITSIPFARAVHHFTPPLDEDPNGVREQLNEITGFVDGSMVYGSSENRVTFLREFSGGRMRMQNDDSLLPFATTEQLGGDAFTPPEINIGGPRAAEKGIEDILFVGGDPRVNEQPGLTAIHTLFVREHNRVAGILDSIFDDSDENIFQLARKVVIGEIQHITYTEFLPLLIGDFAPNPEDYSFDASVNPGVAQEFASCAFRVGHTFLSGDLLMHNGVDPTGNLNLVDGFFNPQMFIDFPGLIDELLIGQTNQAAEAADMFVIDEVRTNLFGLLGSSTAAAGVGLDLVALNVQRARDHGVNKYNEVRAGYGLDRRANFNEVSSDPVVVERLTNAYGGNDQAAVDLCDPWICGLAEDPASGLLGEFFSTIIGDQFTRSMNGDSFFYTGDADLNNAEFTGLTGLNVFSTSLADIINFNTIGGVTPNAMQI